MRTAIASLVCWLVGHRPELVSVDHRAGRQYFDCVRRCGWWRSMPASSTAPAAEDGHLAAVVYAVMLLIVGGMVALGLTR